MNKLIIISRHYIVDEYYNNYFSDRKDEFLNACKVICDVNNNILGTCFLWKISAGLWSIQWFKVINQYANKGVGRQLLSYVLTEVKLDFPIILHTHAASFSAIKLYGDFGFEFLTDNYIGSRKNGLNDSFDLIRKNIKLKEFHFTSLSDSEREVLASFDSEDF
ncbi:GNAT family N-acetyltransferase [Tetragenococcus halophilus]|uniref:GNAT family N-acetyltransferase n=1 Tax=Tetragenococcus halophilus TaxID=51669 RepID=UPI001BB4601E|nr:GNAT family N-acetyltransferase [Tetragenococcus halophilus]